MALAKKMMQGGVSAGAAKAINGDIASALTATGTTQGTALALNAALNVMGTVSSGTGVILPACELSDDLMVYNGGANALLIYPDSGAKINGQSTNAAISLATATAIKLKRVSATQWVGILSA